MSIISVSIAPNVGAISKYLDRVRTDPRYGWAKSQIAGMTEKLPQGELLLELGKYCLIHIPHCNQHLSSLHATLVGGWNPSPLLRR